MTAWHDSRVICQKKAIEKSNATWIARYMYEWKFFMVTRRWLEVNQIKTQMYAYIAAAGVN